MAAVSPEDDEGEGQLGDPDSKFTLSELEDTIVVGGHGMRGGQKPADRSNTFEANEDEVMEGASTNQSKLDGADAAGQNSPTSATSLNKLKPTRQSLGVPGAKGVLLGTWRDSNVPDDDKKHAVIGFIDVRDRL
ncbi:hypothetical protein MAC_09404 [Metarhizium acridum CQMa 102]|uniref:Uncharacterized protein n=1 Tax=Metarhizium acridum (strain CQMa 102) TaxID=655827 RepID=E9EHQ6_METAQ|nr:uncharacterized protein MAC_09404 [Metarhizium acridum CQMa 102]EFY84558.1 hypothetical protein MAC_09404 [Metarhizium acridum CQMa 102]